MSKRDWLIIYCSMIFVFVSDHLLKRWAMGLEGISWHGPLGLCVVYNPGAMLGMFRDMPPLLRIVALSTGGGFLLVTFAIIQYLLPLRSLLLRAGLGILLAGILGNVIDRTIWGHVVDFLLIRAFGFQTAVFNPADAYQWLGYAFVITALFRDGELLWPENEFRGKYWINPKFQLGYCFKLMGLGLGFSIISGIFTYSYLRVTVLELGGTLSEQHLFQRFLLPFITTYAIITCAFAAIMFWFGKHVSHRIAGPIYAFQRFVMDVVEGKTVSLKLRSSDQFAELEQTAVELKQKLQKLQSHPVNHDEESSTVSLGDHLADGNESEWIEPPKKVS